MNLEIVEEYDGRLQEFKVMNGDKILGTFDTIGEAEEFIEKKQNAKD